MRVCQLGDDYQGKAHQEVADHVKQMQERGIIRPSCSPWAAPVVPVRKKDGALRFCVDYHLASGYWQVEVDPKDLPKTAFITRQGLFEFNVLPFGLSNSPKSVGGHTKAKADQTITSAQTTRRRERGPGFGPSWVFRRSRPPDFPVAVGDVYSSASSGVTEGFRSVVSSASAGLPASPVLPAAIEGSPTLQISMEAEVSPALTEVSAADSGGPFGSSAIVREPPLPAGFTVAEEASRSDLSPVGRQLLTPATTEWGRPRRTRKPPVWFKDYEGTC
ncbi:Retrovirus-related Pol poly from transposon [Labeo rohita]|uniref:Retrovirus-related Pol poly from transposon n=1 Tax=Labeo rohita TaxID=84645 RepID=A0A498MEB0_LABRO|nr:Retrovirus-related Pol poly from transposon [Labeo rohita]